MSTAYFLIGPPASGKSTWRKNYLAVTSRPTVVISTDDLIDDYAHQNSTTYAEAFKDVKFASLEQTVMQKFHQAVEDGSDIIIDRTNMNRKSRKRFLDLLPASYDRRAVVFHVGRQELQRRLDARAASTGKHIPVDVVDSMIRSYIAPEVVDFSKIDFA